MNFINLAIELKTVKSRAGGAGTGTKSQKKNTKISIITSRNLGIWQKF